MIRNRNGLRYLPWLARDVARGPGLLFLLGSLVIAVAVWRVQRGLEMSFDPALIQSQTFRSVLLVTVLIATGGMVSTDLQQGYYRAWFSKPMAPWWYYLQRWLLGGLAVLATPVVFGGALALLFGKGAGLSGALLTQVALGYLLIGSAVFLLSCVTRRDWLAVFLLSFAQSGLENLLAFRQVDIPAALVWIHRLLPPFHLVEVGGPTIAGGTLRHVVGYGAGMLALAIVLLLRRPLGSGGRA